MNIALIIAGGVGARVGQKIPKQFLTINEVPIIIYTLKVFQAHPDINQIVVVTLPAWQDVVMSYCSQFGITKLSDIVDGGSNRFESMKNGVKYLTANNDPNDIILVHDANRPKVNFKIIDDAIKTCREKGNALPAIVCVDSMYESSDGMIVEKVVDRKNFYCGQSPETIRLGDLNNLCDIATQKECGDTIASMLLNSGQKVNFSYGSELNFKITTSEDIDLFKALLTIDSDS